MNSIGKLHADRGRKKPLNALIFGRPRILITRRLLSFGQICFSGCLACTLCGESMALMRRLKNAFYSG